MQFSANDAEMPVPSALASAAQEDVLATEQEFYRSYDWCLNRFLTVREAIVHLRAELDRCGALPVGWQRSEAITNIFLLSCGLLNCADEYLRGSALRLPNRVAGSVAGRGASRLLEIISAKPSSRRLVNGWRGRWVESLNEFLVLAAIRQAPEPARLAEACGKLTRLLELQLPADFQRQLLGTPTAFDRLDLTQEDVLALGDCFVRRFPDRGQAILLIGLRTSGSYFAPLLRAFFAAKGYQNVALLTIKPNKGLGRREATALQGYAARGYCALVLDDPPETSRTALAALEIAGRAGFARSQVKFMAPTHPAKPGWFKMLPRDSVITLPPEQWHKRALLVPEQVERPLAEYFRNRGFSRVSVAATRRADEFSATLRSTGSDERGERLKRIFEVELENAGGDKETKYVLAKSVGWGWFGYHAFLIGHRLNGFVTPILGLRDGILFTEWIPQSAAEASWNRTNLIDAAAAYVAARARHLGLSGDTANDTDLRRYGNGAQLLVKALSRAYGRPPVDLLMQSRLSRLVREQPCPCPTLIDGNMDHSEWIAGPGGPLKTDYEHHGMGKAALNVADPAYDLADTILSLALPPDEERRLIAHYVAQSGDAAVERRLFVHKVLAGLWTMNQIQERLFSSPRGSDTQRDYHRRFMNAWDFLTVHTARHCGLMCHPSSDLRWHAPLVVLDVDGVLDRRLFGFPCTTAAGVKALSLLRAHGVSVALNTARSAAEVRDYCQAYALAGGIAEYGAYLWDAVAQRERVLVSGEAVRQLETLRRHLRGVPGVFLDDRHRYTIRAFTYVEKPKGLMRSLLARSSSIGDGAVAPISTQVIHQLLVDLRLDQLTFHHTTIDTAVVAKEVDKGTGLAALCEWVLAKDAETIAVGDGEPDLAMFRVATRSFAPANVGPRRQALLLGCQIVSAPSQPGLLEIVRKIVHADGEKCERCDLVDKFPRDDEDLLQALLEAADRGWISNLRRAILDPAAYKVFIR
jgi:hydroxymethylpyrimidine pyrophosphatase-like HAD family hydrolase